jgi:hypothetical protein
MATTQTNVADVPPGIATPDRVESRLGTLNFTDGVPDAATAQKLFDELDYVHAVTAFINGYAAVNQLALLKGFRAAGVNDNDVLVTSGLMDAKCLFLTANADTYYFWSHLDLTKGYGRAFVREKIVAASARRLGMRGELQDTLSYLKTHGATPEDRICKALRISNRPDFVELIEYLGRLGLVSTTSQGRQLTSEGRRYLSEPGALRERI